MRKITALFLVVCFVMMGVLGCKPAVIDVPVNNPDATVLISIEPVQTAAAPLSSQTPLPTADITAAITAKSPTPLPTMPTSAATEAVKTQAPTEKPTEAVNTPKRTEEPSGKKYIALTFDDGPSKRGTSKILDVLEKHNAKATFFIVGKSNPPNEDSAELKEFKYSMLRRMVSIGCEIANHTMEHKHLPKLSASEIRSQVEGVNDIVRDASGTSTKLVRPPYGDKSQLVYDNVDYPLILWSIDTLDWKTKNADSTYREVMDNIRDGDIVLMHDIHSPTADAVEKIVPALIERGYELVTVSELFEIKGIDLQPGKYYRKAY